MRQRNQRTLAIFALSIALIATTVAYAVLQTSLNISASVTRKGGSWDIAITEIGQYEDSWGGSGTGTTYSELAPIGNGATASINGTTATLNVTLNPGETKKFYVDVTNRGTLDAQLLGFYVRFEDGQKDVSTIAENYNYGPENEDSVAINKDGHLKLTITESLTSSLTAGGSQRFEFTIYYDILDKTELVNATDSIDISMVYKQAA